MGFSRSIARMQMLVSRHVMGVILIGRGRRWIYLE